MDLPLPCNQIAVVLLHKERGVRQLWDDIAIDNPAIGLFLEQGFVEDHRSVSQVYLKKDL